MGPGWPGSLRHVDSGSETIGISGERVDMPGVFLCHSSSDKPFVRRLAADLVANGIPVWFDEWELELGQELTKRVLESLDESSLMLVLLSPTSVESPWVRRELVVALEKEKPLSSGREFIVPLLIGECTVPSEIADRLRIDFRQGYSQSVDRLTSFLRSKGAHNVEVPIDKQLIPLVVSDLFNLSEVHLQRRVEYLMKRYGKDMKVDDRQLVIAGDEEYGSIRSQLLRLKERSEVYKDHDLRMRVHQTWEDFSRIERGLSSGLVVIINGMVNPDGEGLWGWVGESCHRFFRAVRISMAPILLARDIGNNLNSSVLAEFFDLLDHPFYTKKGAASFLGASEIGYYAVWNDRTQDYFKMWLPKDGYIARHVPRPAVTTEMENAFSLEEWALYAVPQMVYRRVFSPPSLLAWRPTGLRIGAD